jgi:hypothetical protein
MRHGSSSFRIKERCSTRVAELSSLVAFMRAALSKEANDGLGPKRQSRPGDAADTSRDLLLCHDLRVSLREASVASVLEHLRHGIGEVFPRAAAVLLFRQSN